MNKTGLGEIVRYLVFGVLTTVVNIVVYTVSARLIHLSVLVSNVLAWLLSVLFAYVTNRSFVFSSKASGAKAIAGECLGFFAGRLATGILDTILMVILVDIFALNDILTKCFVNVVVIILNYVISKLFVFRKREDRAKGE